nr:putative ribonuclease H-like domain-containing protein [Tanacetum cinerariifolium]
MIYDFSHIKEIRLFLAYASFKDFVVYQIDVKSSFLYGKIKEKVYVCQPTRFEDPEFPNKVYKVEKALYGLHQAPKACTIASAIICLDKQLDGMPTHKENYDVSFHTKKAFVTMKRIGTGFSGKETPLFLTMVGPNQIQMGEGVNTPQSYEDRLKHIELMKIYTTLQKEFLDMENELKRTKTAQQTKIDGLERRVKKLEKQHRRIDKIVADKDIALVSTHDNVVQDEGIKDVGEEEVVEVVTTAKMIIDTVGDAAHVTTAIADIPVSAAETIVTIAPTNTAESTKINVEVKVDTDYQLAERLQAEEQQELNEEEKAKLFMELLEKRRKLFAAKRNEEKRNRPPTKV